MMLNLGTRAAMIEVIDSQHMTGFTVQLAERRSGTVLQLIGACIIVCSAIRSAQMPILWPVLL